MYRRREILHGIEPKAAGFCGIWGVALRSKKWKIDCSIEGVVFFCAREPLPRERTRKLGGVDVGCPRGLSCTVFALEDSPFTRPCGLCVIGLSFPVLGLCGQAPCYFSLPQTSCCCHYSLLILFTRLGALLYPVLS